MVLKLEPYYYPPQKILDIQKPIVFLSRGFSADNLPESFIKMIGKNLSSVQSLPTTHPLLINFDWITKANPYPPLLGEYSHYSSPSFLSFGYIDNLGKYRQVTLYGGEADTTPSPFVNKVRGRGTYYGDYFIKYQIFLSKRISPKPLVTDREGHVVKWKPLPGRTEIDEIEWSTYSGGSYDGFEELGFTLIASAIQWVLLVILLTLRNQKKA